MDHGNYRMPNLDIICPFNETRASKHQPHAVQSQIFAPMARINFPLPTYRDTFIYLEMMHEEVVLLQVTRIGYHLQHFKSIRMQTNHGLPYTSIH